MTQSSTLRRRVLGASLLSLCVPAAQAQLNNQWVEFTRNDGSLGAGLANISSFDTEVDFAWGDFDKNGLDDLAIVRKEAFTSAGKRTNLLLMNEGGVLVDRTGQYARQSDVAGDVGFGTPTNDRDVVAVDLDGDSWLDLVTAPTLSDGDTKEVGHPRVYMNLGNDEGGLWQGFRYEAGRIPQMFHFGNGLPTNPRFCSVAAGDVTGDGAPDLYFGDYDSGPSSNPGNDMNNRLLINDGNGFFSDESQSRMNSTMLLSAFGAASAIADMNGDGVNDVVKQTALNPPQHVAVVYNNPNNEGVFNIYDDFMNNEPYHINVGHLNNDGRLDLIVSSDGQDRFRYNRGNDPLGRVIWSEANTFQFAPGFADDGFASNNIIADLDNDGWGDALFADVDVDITGYGRRIHIYHNPGGDTPDAEPTLREERETGTNSGWIGAVGFEESDLIGGHDIAPMDLDGDGDLDLVIGRGVGMFVWINQTVENSLFQDGAELSLAAGATQTLDLQAGAEHAGETYFVLGSATGTAPALSVDGLELPLVFDDWFQFTLSNPNGVIQNSLGVLDAQGEASASLEVPAGTDPNLAGLSLFHAFVSFDGSGQAQHTSNAVPALLVP